MIILTILALMMVGQILLTVISVLARLLWGLLGLALLYLTITKLIGG